MVMIDNFDKLLAAAGRGERDITITRGLTVLYPIILPAKAILKGRPQENGILPLVIFPNSDGFGVSQGNTIMNLRINVASDKRAIFLADNSADLGNINFENLQLTGQLSFITRHGFKYAHLQMTKIDVVSADARHYFEQPQKYGVNVFQGAITIYNFNPDDSLIEMSARNISIGREGAPVLGSGVFLAGFGDVGGRVEISELQTQAIYSTGGIPFGVFDLITGAIFILNGAQAHRVIHDGPITTYGVNDMVLDAWGTVDYWQVNDVVTSYGPSGVGFVNFGAVTEFEANAPIETYGLGARGYKQYDGFLKKGTFQDIRTFGDGSVGVQISKTVEEIIIKGSIETYGSVGNSLVRGQNEQLPANALSIKAGGLVGHLVVSGSITTYGDHVVSYKVDNGGAVKRSSVAKGIRAFGVGSQEVN